MRACCLHRKKEMPTGKADALAGAPLSSLQLQSSSPFLNECPPSQQIRYPAVDTRPISPNMAARIWTSRAGSFNLKEQLVPGDNGQSRGRRLLRFELRLSFLTELIRLIPCLCISADCRVLRFPDLYELNMVLTSRACLSSIFCHQNNYVEPTPSSNHLLPKKCRSAGLLA
jgi:hypothetical protein